jgi:predicted amidohydrolase YtcJ
MWEMSVDMIVPSLMDNCDKPGRGIFSTHLDNAKPMPAAWPALLIIAACAALRLAEARGADVPDTLYVNGTVITMDSVERVAQAVAVKGDKIAAVGATAELQKTAGPATTVIDLKGKVLLPGFIDAHSHFPGSGEAALGSVDLQAPPVGGVRSLGDLVQALRQKARQTPKGEWIQGWGYDQTLLAEGRHPTRYDLDQASTNHPIYIEHTSGHLCVANSLALRLAGIDRHTAQPKGGVIRKDPETGEPDGVFEEVGAMIGSLIPPPTAEQQMEAVKWAVSDYASNGVTTATIAGGGIPRAVERARQAGLLGLRVVAMLSLSGKAATGAPPAGLIGDERLKTGLTVKGMQDGSPQGFTAYFTQPYYTGRDPSYRGYARRSREELTAWVKQMHRLGYQVAIHANGDAAIDDVLSAYREAQKDFPRPDARHRIEHAQFAREDQLDQMKELGISPSFFVSHTYYWGDAHRDLVAGPERAAQISPLQSALKRGIRFSIHLDTPVTPMRPLQAVWSAVNRVTRSGKTLGPDQRITPRQALRAVTIDAAWQEHDENVKGSIEVGKFADFVVLAENPIEVAPLKIKDIAVLQTIVGGRSVFKRAD